MMLESLGRKVRSWSAGEALLETKPLASTSESTGLAR
jgi:hypothetical protein